MELVIMLEKLLPLALVSPGLVLLIAILGLALLAGACLVFG